ncbi:hypothetical protein ASPVEDRAFT_39183 [Aspergillus versicolor CBS 583.65]|uniref:Zn(2)-C6 fungal-type domain-containing protein n=1 Tax=Aspergillus versicolor CBS 583.65 TaxID=1036611 RepID=A0A1L9PEE6_ASPVE|nr:uncharacterized protein ASPVEDRAFT_39183 [Aspergillus versicolor CBS 583.65]OJI99824.1 hypothetical protein ASPVEDRAFT_39183 [Aspergillus versicolor CBS 583.65]
MNYHPEEAVSKRSCLRCSRRKVRCDRAHPCARCIQASAESECSYPGSAKRVPRVLNRPPISVVMARLKELEGEVARLRGREECERFSDAEGKAGNWDRVGARFGNGRYVGDEASVVLGDKIRELREAYDVEEGTESDPERDSDDYLVSSVLEPERVKILWSIYKRNVAPMIAILHKPSIDDLVTEFCATPNLLLDPAPKALLLAICFAATVSSTDEECLSISGQTYDSCVLDYQLATEQVLTRPNLISSQDFRILQAAVLFLLCLRCNGDSRVAWAETAIVVRVAQKQGLHRDGQSLGLSPFDTEMRRRLWWHLCILDMLCSEDQGTETQIMPAMFDTQIPVNIDSDELTVDMDLPPSNKLGFTDITLCIIHCEMMINLYWVGKSFNPQQAMTIDRVNLLSTLSNRLENEYLDRFNLNIPIQWITAVITRLALSKAWLVVRLQASLDNANTDTNTNKDEIFHMAIETLKFANLLQTNEPTAQWAWLSKTYKHQHVLAFALSELCVRPASPEVAHAWDVVTEFYNMSLQGRHRMNSMLQRPLARLMERASIVRNGGAEPVTKPGVESELSYSVEDWLRVL